MNQEEKRPEKIWKKLVKTMKLHFGKNQCNKFFKFTRNMKKEENKGDLEYTSMRKEWKKKPKNGS